MSHPVGAAGLLYYGNRSADICLALFGEKQATGFEHSIGQLEASSVRHKTITLQKNKVFQKWLIEADIRLTATVVDL